MTIAASLDLEVLDLLLPVVDLRCYFISFGSTRDRDHCEMDPDQFLRVGIAQLRADQASPVTTLSAELSIAKLICHQLQKELGHPCDIHATLLGTIGETKTRQGRDHDMEGVLCITPISGGIGQRSNNLVHLE